MTDTLIEDEILVPTSPTLTVTGQHAKVVTFVVTQGSDDRDRTIEQFIEDVRACLDGANVKRYTSLSSYYILDGKVCLTADYDPETQARIPGTVPPQWAGGPTDAEKREAARKVANEERIQREAALEAERAEERRIARETALALRNEAEGADVVAEPVVADDGLSTAPRRRASRTSRTITAAETADITAAVGYLGAAITGGTV